MARIDHASAAVADLEVVAGRLWERYGLGVQRLAPPAAAAATTAAATTAAGPAAWVAHVPLGPGSQQYVELHTPQAPGPLGERMARLLAERSTDAVWYGWCVEVDDMDARVAALGIPEPIAFGTDPERTFTPWSGRFAGTARMAESGGFLPYLIEYDQPPDELERIFAAKRAAAQSAAQSANQTGAAHAVGGIATIELAGDADALRAWLGGPPPEGVTVSPHAGDGAPPGVLAVSITVDGTARRIDLGPAGPAAPTRPGGPTNTAG